MTQSRTRSRNAAYSIFEETMYDWAFPTVRLHQAMIPVLIVLLLLTALVATEPTSPGGGGEGT